MSEYRTKVLEEFWDPDIHFSPKAPRPKPKFIFVKTGHKRMDQHNFPAGSRVLPLGNYLADDYSVADSIVLDALAHARAQSAEKNTVRTKYDTLELNFFDRYGNVFYIYIFFYHFIFYVYNTLY